MLDKRQFELLTELDKYEPGKIGLFHAYNHSLLTLGILLTNLDTAYKAFGNVSVHKKESGLYYASYDMEDPNADDYIRILEGDCASEIRAAKQTSLVELILLKSRVDYDKALISMPLNQAFNEINEPISLDHVTKIRQVRHS